MTDEDTPRVNSGASSRRSFMKKGAASAVSVALVGSGLDTVVAQDDGILDEGWKALIFADNFHPQARFTFVSGVIEWNPNYGDVRDSLFTDFDTYQIRWLNTDEIVPLFVAQDANIGEYDENLGFIPDADDDADQPQLFEMEKEWTPFGDNPRLITVNASPVAEDEEDEILENEDWWREGGAETTPGNETATPGNQTTTPGNQSVFDG